MAEAGGPSIRIAAAAYLPFEPRTAELRELRSELRDRLSVLTVADGEILAARLFGPLPRGADVENALLFNVDMDGGTFAAATASGVRFEHDPEPLPDGGVRYEYGAERPEAPFRIWAPIRSLAEIAARLEAPPSLAAIWWALRERGEIRVTGPARGPGEPFAVFLRLGGPVRAARPALVKALIDGVVCALQSQTDRQDVELTAPRIASGLGVATERVREHLLNSARSVLGVRARLAHRRGKGVQWAPDDDACVAGEVLLEPAERWQISGSVFAVRRVLGVLGHEAERDRAGQ